jgi:hypothetical protein
MIMKGTHSLQVVDVPEISRQQERIITLDIGPTNIDNVRTPELHGGENDTIRSVA